MDISKIEYDGYVDLSKIQLDDQYEYQTENIFFRNFWFIAPKELLGDKYPEAEHATIAISYSPDIPSKVCPNHIIGCQISPTKDGIDYDWKDFDLDYETIMKLLKMAGIEEENHETK